MTRLRPARQEISCELWSSHFTRAEARERVTGSDEHRAIPNRSVARMPNQAADRRYRPRGDGLFFHRCKNLGDVRQSLHESRRVHFTHKGPHLGLTPAPDELCDAEAFEPSRRVPKPGFWHRAKQVLPRGFRGNARPVRRTKISAHLQL